MARRWFESSVGFAIGCLVVFVTGDAGGLSIAFGDTSYPRLGVVRVLEIAASRPVARGALTLPDRDPYSLRLRPLAADPDPGLDSRLIALTFMSEIRAIRFDDWLNCLDPACAPGVPSFTDTGWEARESNVGPPE